ncbi:hypothetical protein L579_2148 [Pantoea sp. AS-PWVM4]|nr:hypothetical protein L579_2148 [Pantoea sp. AS-PWVM4]
MLNFGYELVKGFRGGNFRFNRTNVRFLFESTVQMTKTIYASQ